MHPNRLVGPLVLALALVACSSDPAASGDAADAGNNGDAADTGDTGPTGNRSPDLARIGDKRAVVDRDLIIELRATDPDGDAIEFSVIGDLPSGAKFDKETARFNWTPTADDLGSQWLLTFSASDGSLSDRETITITVAASLDNSPPQFIDPGDQLLAVGEPYTLLLEAIDPDGDRLVFGIVGTSPEGSSFDEHAGLFAWAPGPEDEDNTYRILFEVSDGTETDDLFVNLRVGSAALRFGAIPPQEVHLGEALSFTLAVDNPAGQTYACSALGTLPAGAAFDAAACRFDWTPTDATLVNRTLQVPFEVAGDDTTLVRTASITVLPARGGDCVADAFEADEAGGFAAPIEPGEYPGLTLCGSDDDAFSLALEVGVEVEVTVTFEHDVVDVDLALWAPSDTDEPYRISEGVTDRESIRIDSVPEAGDWEIDVYGIGAGDTTYDLTIAVSDTARCTDDGFEENDTRATAHQLAPNASVTAQYCFGDQDWFDFFGQVGESATVSLESLDGVDLDLQIYAPGAAEADWLGLDVGPTEVVEFGPLPASGRYAIEVFGFGETDSAYTLQTSRAACLDDDDDAGAGNDTGASATELIDGEIRAGRVFCDPDWYFVILEVGEGALFTVDYDVSAYPPPTVSLLRLAHPGFLGVVESDELGVSVYLGAAPAEDIYVLGILDAEPGMPYDVGYLFFDND